MTRNEWLDRCGFLFAVMEVEHFTPLEVCDVGRKPDDEMAAKGLDGIAGTADDVRLVAPSRRIVRNALTLIEGPLLWIRGYRGAAPVSVNSWFRDPVYNEAVGGAENSMHLTCGAADIVKSGWTPEEVALALHHDFEDSDFLGIGLYNTFVHVDIRGMIGRQKARWAGKGVDPDWWRLAA